LTCPGNASDSTDLSGWKGRVDLVTAGATPQIVASAVLPSMMTWFGESTQ
jgi:hypothetical protein